MNTFYKNIALVRKPKYDILMRKKSLLKFKQNLQMFYSFRYAFKNAWEEWLKLRDSSHLSLNLFSLPVLFQFTSCKFIQDLKVKQTYPVMSNESNHDFPHKTFCHHTYFNSINITEAARIWFGSILGI